MRFFGWQQRLFDEAAEGGTGGGGGQVTETPEQKIARLERENGELKTGKEAAETKAREHEESAKFWHGKARGAAEAPTNRDGQTKPKDDEEDDNTDFLALAAQGPKAVKAWLAHNGFVSRTEAEAMTNAKANALVKQAEIVRKYPDLNDQNSDFFKDVTAEYGKLKADGVPEMKALEIAADLIGARRGAKTDDTTDATTDGDKGKGKGRQGETEEERRSRARAAGGEGRGGTKQAKEGDELTPEQKRICEAFGITEEQYRKRAKEGVQYAR